MRQFIFLLSTFFTTASLAQEFEVNTVTPLDDAVYETSGLIQIEDRLITHNDSGGGHYLYEVDAEDGEVVRTVVVANASNVDWEDLCRDETCIYIGEFGNNAGTRTDLKVYRITISDYLTATNDTVYCDTIAFNYADQTDFEPAVYTTNYDAEAFIAHNDSLYIFTKNWGNYETNIYALPKTPGTYSISIVDQINTEALITGAAYDAEKNEILLTGYTFFDPVLFFIKGFSGNAFSDGNLTRTSPYFEGSMQIEGVCASGNHTYYVSSENEGETDSFLHEVSISNFIGIPSTELPQLDIYPNPAGEVLTIDSPQINEVFIFDQNGKLVQTTSHNTVNISLLPSGKYTLLVFGEANSFIGRRHFVKR